jgi:hypothetical protein
VSVRLNDGNDRPSESARGGDRHWVPEIHDHVSLALRYEFPDRAEARPHESLVEKAHEGTGMIHAPDFRGARRATARPCTPHVEEALERSSIAPPASLVPQFPHTTPTAARQELEEGVPRRQVFKARLADQSARRARWAREDHLVAP